MEGWANPLVLSLSPPFLPLPSCLHPWSNLRMFHGRREGGDQEALGGPRAQAPPAGSRPAVRPGPLAQLSPNLHLHPASYLMLVNLQPLKARLLEVTWAGLQGEKSTVVLSSHGRGLILLMQGPEQTHNVTESPQCSLLNVLA